MLHFNKNTIIRFNNMNFCVFSLGNFSHKTDGECSGICLCVDREGKTHREIKAMDNKSLDITR